MTEEAPTLSEILRAFRHFGVKKEKTPRTKRPTLEERFNEWLRLMDEYMPDATREQRIGLLYAFAEHLKITTMMAYIRQTQVQKKPPLRRVTL